MGLAREFTYGGMGAQEKLRFFGCVWLRYVDWRGSGAWVGEGKRFNTEWHGVSQGRNEGLTPRPLKHEEPRGPRRKTGEIGKEKRRHRGGRASRHRVTTRRLYPWSKGRTVAHFRVPLPGRCGAKGWISRCRWRAGILRIPRAQVRAVAQFRVRSSLEKVLREGGQGAERLRGRGDWRRLRLASPARCWVLPT